MSEITVRNASADDVVDVLRLVDAALLAIDHDAVATAIERDDALVAVDDETVVGALVLAPQERGAHVEAIAVHRDRRGQGIGRQLVDAAAERNSRLTADFRPEVEPFWHSLGFRVERRGDRLWGERRTDTS
jgi:GNAT superfamily N-acetyltransferase